MKILRFLKYDTGAWFLDSPDYIEAGGDPRELQMVAGADEFLDYLTIGSEEQREVNLEITTAPKGGWNVLRRRDDIPNQIGSHYQDEGTTKLMWLCPVTLFVFGEYPAQIYYKKV